MPPDADVEFWARQSPVSDPGRAGGALDSLPADPDALTQISSQLVFHYRADGDWAANGIAPERAAEINLCYVADMFARLLELDPSLRAERVPACRLLGCCRDFSTLYTAMLRHHGIAARCRVGFAGYFDPGWWVDHVVVEVFDGVRWRMIDPELRPEFSAPDGAGVNRLDVSPERFMSGSRAWVAVRAGRLDPERVVVSPHLEVPDTRGWPQLAHNLVHDVAALNRTELLLWQDWGASLTQDVLAPDVAEVLDRVAAVTADVGVTPALVRHCSEHHLLRVPDIVRQIDPVSLAFSEVDVRRALADTA